MAYDTVMEELRHGNNVHECQTKRSFSRVSHSFSALGPIPTVDKGEYVHLRLFDKVDHTQRAAGKRVQCAPARGVNLSKDSCESST